MVMIGLPAGIVTSSVWLMHAALRSRAEVRPVSGWPQTSGTITGARALSAAGAWLGTQPGGGAGNIALISATCAVLGSLVPGAARKVRGLLRGRPRLS